MAGPGPICLFVILFIGANGLEDGCLFVCYHFDWGWLLAVFFSIVLDGSGGGFVVVVFSFHFFDQVRWIGGGCWGRLVAALLVPSRPSAQASRCQKEFSC